MAAIIKSGFVDSLKEYKKKLMSYIPYYYQSQYYRDYYEYLMNSRTFQNESFHIESLNKILGHCYKNIPYYGDLFDSNQIDPCLHSMEDFQKIPFITKDIISNNIDKLVYKNGKCKIRKRTGGTTGLPMDFWTDKNDAIRENAFVHYHWNKVGFDNKKNNRIVIMRGFIPKGGSFYEKNNNNLILSTFMLSYKTIDLYIEQLNKFNPEFLHVYPSSLDLFVSLLKFSKHKLELKELKGIFTSSETLNDYQRYNFEKEFKVQVSDLYGHSEHCVFAIKNKNNKVYEIDHRYGFVELLRNRKSVMNKVDSTGDIVATSYHNYIMPLIRYKTGDKATSSGSSLGFINIQGREQDFFIDKDGINIPYICNDEAIWCIKDKIIAYQYSQNKRGIIKLKLENISKISTSDLKRVYDQFCHIYPTLTLKIETECKIARTDKGKFKYLVKNI
ncbi:hypothetical protein [Photobacterium leiognathi]|uniref:hypothetical protein n=1 Tax=Photobacterium leiognathi TaxID=553611 RepID=UPI00298224D5|nr:hypothetical protein [Photobacterium leiognathi]